MEIKQAIDVIKNLVEQGNLEEALQSLVALCDSAPHYAELGQTARVNQADYFQLRSKMLRGVVSAEETRLITNQITENTLELVQQLERGQFDLGADEQKAGKKSVWRYYVAGGIVSLAAALLIWRLAGDPPPERQKTDCPTFESEVSTRVMLLPFQRENPELQVKPETDIADGLTSLFSRTPEMKQTVSVDVSDSDDNQNKYLSAAEAAEKARACGVHLIIWGRVSGSSKQNYKLRVNYRLLNANQILQSGDTTISRLVTVTDQGDLSQDAEAVYHLIYMVLANQLGANIPPAVWASLNAPKMSQSNSANAPVDTLAAMILAEHYIKEGQVEQAIKQLDQILAVFPSNTKARQTRAALLYGQGKYAEAADDLEVAIPSADKASAELNRARVQTNLKIGRIDRSEQSLRILDKNGESKDKWFKNKEREVRDSTTAMTIRLQALERLANVRQKPSNVLEAAQLSQNLGNNSKAEKYANIRLQMNPKDTQAAKIYVQANLEQKDTAQAIEKLKDLESKGFNVKGILQDQPDLNKRIKLKN